MCVDGYSGTFDGGGFTITMRCAGGVVGDNLAHGAEAASNRACSNKNIEIHTLKIIPFVNIMYPAARSL